ncbi:MAG: hypothetical protein CMH83_05825 [Nocardioides sp.]|nr:hypothetical protein [Nocardioides sp.]
MVISVALGAFHVGHLDAVSGHGLLLVPRGEDDVVLDGESLFSLCYREALLMLETRGWRPRHDEEGRLSYIGCTESGTLAAELVSGSPITAAPDPATRELLYAAAGILSADA